MNILEVKNLNKSFGSFVALKDINFELESRTVLAVIGSSGSGKTTLLRCLNNLTSFDSGEIKLNYDNKTDSVPNTNGMDFGLVFQSYNLFPQYSALENIQLPALIANKKIDKKNYKSTSLETAKSLLDLVGLTDKANSYPHELSGGQLQRIAIARALAVKPKILCFDEPTSALDNELTQGVLALIKKLKNQNLSMIIVTHDLSFAKNVADKIMFMANGKVEGIGSPQDLFENPQSEIIKNFLKNSALAEN